MDRAYRQDDAQGRVYRRDRATVTGSSRTETGFLVARANIAKTGPLRYLNADGTERIELVLADELFADKSLSTFRSAPVVLIHPAEKILTPDTARRLSVGWPSDGRAADDQEHVDCGAAKYDIDFYNVEMLVAWVATLCGVLHLTSNAQHHRLLALGRKPSAQIGTVGAVQVVDEPPIFVPQGKHSALIDALRALDVVVCKPMLMCNW